MRKRKKRRLPIIGFIALILAFVALLGGVMPYVLSHFVGEDSLECLAGLYPA